MESVQRNVAPREAEAARTESVWTRLPRTHSRFVLLGFIPGIVLIVAGSAGWGLEIQATGFVGDGILYLPLDLAVAAYAALMGISVLLAVRAAAADHEVQSLARLGGIWVLASIPLMFDFLIDSFPGKLLINVLSVLAGIRYWKGLRNATSPSSSPP